ncbi:MAG: hypothetical protein HC913_01590 [Microscillaceae bacterium]|nr:hypothetical protein [Microscillaceae bacterium]
MPTSSCFIWLFRIKNAQIQREKERAAEQKQDYERQLGDLAQRLESQIKRAKKLESDNNKFIDSLQNVLKEVQQDRDNLRQTSQLTQNQVATFRQKIEAYEVLLRKKDEEIEKLRETAQILYDENNDLKVQKNELTSTITEISKERTQMQGKLDQAAVLKAENVNVNAVDDRGREQSGGQYRANKIDRLAITFNVADNKLARIGNKDVYMRVLEPAGTLLINPGSSGSFEADGRQMQYSVRKQILFDNSRQTVRFDFDRTGEFVPGRHTIEFYCEGYRIGYGTFEVR